MTTPSAPLGRSGEGVLGFGARCGPKLGNTFDPEIWWNDDVTSTRLEWGALPPKQAPTPHFQCKDERCVNLPYNRIQETP
ncbi:hypothetical protein H9L39_19462 [Fusarium oxysporum f. sp. albedinis]|nr:hypothetical protein H9L39_19462 [Fusarium oxysporum f. sp. albedinis]